MREVKLTDNMWMKSINHVDPGGWERKGKGRKGK
jgi:hypothetical protein